MAPDIVPFQPKFHLSLRAAAENILLERARFLRQAGITFNGDRDTYEIFGYKRLLNTRDYRDRYARGGIAKRIVEALPNATWRGGLELIEDEDPKKTTAFEKAWDELETRLHIISTLRIVDILAGLSTFSVLLIGGPGDLTEELKKGSPDDLIYLKPFSGGGGPGLSRHAITSDLAADCTIQQFDLDIHSERFGYPSFYQLRRIDIASPDLMKPVHWSRIIHVAEGILDDDVYGQPTLESCWNLLDDLDKVTGGGAEAFFQRANQGMNLNIQKDAVFETEDLAKLNQSAEDYKNNISRILKTREVDVKMLGSDVANFNQPADAILTQIAGCKSIPKRILTGSEMGELASSQDRDNWKDQINGRQTGYAGPSIVRPLVDRFIKYGYLPTPKQYEPKWAHIQTMTEQEKAEGALNWAKTLTTEGPVFLRDEIRDHWYNMQAVPKPDLNATTGEHTSPETGLPVEPKIDPHTGLPYKVPPAPTVATDPDTGLPVEVDTKTGLPAHQTADLTPQEKAAAIKKAKAQAQARLKAAAALPDQAEVVRDLDPAWTITKSGLTRQFSFSDRRECAAFLSALSREANIANHHPDVIMTNNGVAVAYCTHSADNAVTDLDYLAAMRADQLAMAYRTATDGPHSYASTQVNLTGALADKLLAFSAAIPDADLAGDGRETVPHVTVKYGIHSDDPAQIEALLADHEPIALKLGMMTVFRPDTEDYEVLVIPVISPGLRELNALIRDQVEVTDTYPTYRPHVTLAYVAKGKGDAYQGDHRFAGQTATVSQVIFSPSEGEKTTIPLQMTVAEENEMVRVLEAAIVCNNTSVIDKILGIRHAGGPGSGNFDHAGRPGEVGGSQSGGGHGQTDTGTHAGGSASGGAGGGAGSPATAVGSRHESDFAFQTDLQGRPPANEHIKAIAQSYNAAHGIPPIDHSLYEPLNQLAQGAVADAYDKLSLDDRSNPETAAQWAEFGKQIDAQWDHAVANGIKFEPWTKEDQPYNTSFEVAKDLADNQHLYYGVSKDPTMDKLLAVHDLYGHAAAGVGFGPRGEFNAWVMHSQMFTGEARGPMTTRYRGQNAWTHFGAHLYNADGTYKDIPSHDRPDPPMKYATLPREFWVRPGERGLQAVADELRHLSEDVKRAMLLFREAGGAGSGNFGHEGRPGEVGGSGAGGGSEPHVWSQETSHGRPIPIKVDTVHEAVALVLAGKVVEVKDLKTAHTLINKLADMAAEAKAAGKDAKDYNLCDVSVAGSNLFCAESVRDAAHPHGIDRVQMPQLSGRYVEGSKASELPHDSKNEVDGAPAFRAYLKEIGLPTSAEVVRSDSLRASQNELIGSKVAGMMSKMQERQQEGKIADNKTSNAIFISRDNYVIDGHHRWAASVGVDLADGRLGDSKMHVIRVDAPITEVLHLAGAWSKDFGIQQAAGVRH